MRTNRPLAPIAQLVLTAALLALGCDDGSSSQPTCDDPQPSCISACGSDILLQPGCEDGAWSCGEGVEVDTCSAGVCEGSPPFAGARCGAVGNWECAPTDTEVAACPASICGSCVGLDGPAISEGCTCSCDQGSDTVVCESTPQACVGSAPLCAPGCGGDAFIGPADCDAGEWVCAEGVLRTSCPAGTCWGLPSRGEVCSETGWSCEPDAAAFAACPEVMCLTCDGLDAPVTEAGCACACSASEDLVRCQAPTPCVAVATSSLAGVALEVTADDCSFTQSEAAAGVEVGWAVKTDAPVEGVLPQPQDAGGCGQPDGSGLIVFERLSGEGQSYCICDEGLCQGPSDIPVTLPAGTSAGAFTWDGVNWGGPSDTGNPKEAPFPPGSYELTISAKGQRVEGDSQVPFLVEVRVGVEITADP